MSKKMKFVLGFLLISSLAIVALMPWRIMFIPAAEVASNHVVWDEKEYYPAYGVYTEGKTIAKGKDGDWKINSVKEDPSHTFIVARSFLDQYLLVSSDYVVPKEGVVTKVAWNGKYITDKMFVNAVTNIEEEKATTFTYKTDGIFQLTDNQQMRELFFAYEDCPVTTEFKGCLGKVNGEWVITTYISDDRVNPDGSPKQYSVDCYTIPNEYWEILSKYFS